MKKTMSRMLTVFTLGAALLAGSCAVPLSPTLSAPSTTAADASADLSKTVFSSPFVTYEAENGTVSGTISGPDRTYHTIASEASGRKYVSLSATGNSVQWTTTAAANGLNIRYNMADSSGGGGTTGTLSLYVNGTKTQTLSLTSKYAWVYGGYPYSDNPGDGGPLHFFDDTHFLLTSSIPSGATVKLQKDSGDATVNVDLIDLESVPAALAQPSGSFSITSYGAVANDANDDTAAFNSAVTAAGANGTVWIPSGTFILNSRPAAFPNNVTVKGAGMWYSILSGVGCSFTPNAKTIKFYDFAISGNTTHRVDSALEAGIDAGGNGFGSGSVVQNVWFNHLKVGIWTGPMTPSLTVNNCRVWDVFADGINFYNGTTNSSITNTSVRNTGDDGIAIWSGGGNACNNNTVNGNRVEFPTHANGIAVYGGSGNTIQDNTVNDVIQYGSGIYIAARFGEVAFSGTTTVTGNTLNRTGSYDPDYGFGDGGIRLEANDNNVSGTFTISNNTVDSPTYAGVLFVGSGTITGVTFTNLLVNAAATYGVETRSNARGSATFNSSTYGTTNNAAGANFTITGASVSGATGAGGGTSTPVGPAGYTYVANENGSYTLSSPGDVAFGVNGSFNYKYAVSGSVTFNTSTFGDPAPGVAKYGFYKAGPTGPAGYTYCAPENGSFALPSVSDVAFGANGSFNYLYGKTGTVTFNTATFGDPISGTVKAGFYRAAQPDLIVTSISWTPASPTAGQAVTFSAVVKNQGAGTSPAGVKHGLSFTIDGTQVNWTDNYTSSIAAGASVTLTANGGPAGTATWASTSGTHTVAALIDDTSLISETNESNNSFSTSMSVGAGSQPDLIVTNITWSPASPTAGSAVTFTATIKNQGAGPSPSGVKHGVAFTIDGAQGPWCDNSTASIAAGATVTLTANGGPSGATWAATSGTHTIGATIDDQNLIVEANESNNTFSNSLTVGSGGGGSFPVAGTWYKILNRNSGKALEIGGQTTNDGAGADQWDYLSQSNQKWQFVATDSGWYKVIVNNSSKALDVDAASTADGAKVQQWTYGGGNNQQWKPVDLGNGYYELINRNSNKCIDVSGASTTNGAAVQQRTYSSGTNQQWTIVTAN